MGKKLITKIWDVNLELPKIKKATKGFKFKFANLGDIEKVLKPILEKHKIGYGHSLEVENGENILVTTIFNLESEEEVSVHRLLIPKSVSLAGMNEYQALGSGITYYRRYALTTAFGIITDEDVDAITPEVAKVSVDHVSKIRQLIGIGRAKSTLEKYLQTYEPKMSAEQVLEIQLLLKDLK